jgi:hypothetical protein
MWAPQSKILVTQSKVRAQSEPLTSGACGAKWTPNIFVEILYALSPCCMFFPFDVWFLQCALVRL